MIHLLFQTEHHSDAGAQQVLQGLVRVAAEVSQAIDSAP